MVQEKIAALTALGPVVLGTVGVLVVSLLLAAVLSVAINRRAARRAAPVARITRAQVMAARPAGPAGPTDMQERLRRLTAGANGSGAGDDLFAPASASATAPTRAGSAANSASMAVSPLGAGPAGGPVAEARVDASTPGDDATRFFGASADSVDGIDGVDGSGATTFFGEPDAPAPSDDATRFFGAGLDDAAPDATAFFGEEPTAGRAAPAERDDATRFFGGNAPSVEGSSADESVAEDQDRTSFLPPSETRFFAPDELEGETADASEGRTGMLYALPPATKGAMWDTDEVSTSARDTGSLDRVRKCLAAVSTPNVMALSVIDGAGRVLAGETDADLAGELRSLMAESGQGNLADVEQPVRLADESTGAILLLPTGANALLGALISDAHDPQVTRQSLRSVAHDIGDAIRCAS